jgi:gliding motility-associated-like protein
LSKTFLHILCFFLLGIASKAQVNLVPNGSFEEYSDCPLSQDEVYKCIGWQKPNICTTDYCHVCAPTFPGGVTVPNYFMGYQWPYHGQAYMGIGSYVLSSPVSVEYIQCKLTDSLQALHRYRLTFYVSLGDYSVYAINSFGGVVSKIQAICAPDCTPSTLIPQVKFSGHVTDTMNWIKVSGEFIALGGEQWLTIGRFDYNGIGNVSLLPVVPDTNPFFPEEYCYYLVDSVSLYDVSTTADLVNLPNVFTPNGDGTNDIFIMPVFSFFTQQEMRIFNRWGNEVARLSAGSSRWDGTHNGRPCEAGVYYFVFTARDENSEEYLQKGFVQLLR